MLKAPRQITQKDHLLSFIGLTSKIGLKSIQFNFFLDNYPNCTYRIYTGGTVIHIDTHSSDTLQDQILKQIRTLILGGTLEPDSPLPSIRRFAKEHQVSVITVQKSYERLENEGLVYTRKGKGVFVAEVNFNDRQRFAQHLFSERMLEPIHQALAQGIEASDIQRLIKELLEAENAI